MRDRYVNTLSFTGLVVGVPTAIAHGINIRGRGVTPHYVTPNASGFTITADDTNVTVTRQAGAADAVDVFCQFIHTVPGAFGPSANLSINPFVANGLAPSGSAPVGVEVLDTFELVTWYVRPGGDDANDGTSAATAFATLERAFQALRTNVVNLSQRIDITGMKGANKITKANGPWQFPPIVAGFNFDLDVTAPGPNNLSSRQPLQIVSEMDEILPVTITGNSQDPVTTLRTFNVSEVLVVNAHVGQMLIGSGFFEHGVIISNTANTITVAQNSATFSAPVGIYEPGAEIEGGDVADFFRSQGSIIQVLCGLFLSGIKFSSTGDTKPIGAGIYSAGMPVAIQQCEFTGFGIHGADNPTLDCCYIHEQGGNNPSFTLMGNVNSVQIRHGYYSNTAILWDTPWVYVLNGWFEAPQDPVGRTHGVAGRLDLENVEVQNAVSVGVRNRYRPHLEMIRCRVANSGTDGVEILGGTGAHVLNNVQGTGNGGYGCDLQNGAQVNALGTTNITGALGEVRLGASGAVTWASQPNTDKAAATPEFCRIQ